MTDDGIAERVPFGVGAAAGAGAWVFGYLLTYLVTSGTIRENLGALLDAADIGVWQAVGYVFFNAHFVNTVVDVPLIGGATTFIGGDGGFTPLLYVVPALLLLGAGLAVGRSAGAGSMDGANAAVAGASVVIGYGLLSVVGVFVFATENVTPEAVTGILLAGVLYPVALGAAGAVVAKVTDGGL